MDLIRHIRRGIYIGAIALAGVISIAGAAWTAVSLAAAAGGRAGTPGTPHARMPALPGPSSIISSTASAGRRESPDAEVGVQTGGVRRYVWDQCYSMEQSLRID